MSLKTYIIGQFKRPRGPLGMLAGWIMATRPSNRRRNSWTVDLLDLRPADRILEIGCGPGFGLAMAAEKIPHGLAVGLDHSAVMLAQAARRNRGQIAEGRVRLVAGQAGDPSLDLAATFNGTFNRILAVNVASFWKDPVAVFGNLKSLLAPGGIIAITHQPRAGDKTDAAARRTAETIGRAMADAGLDQVRIEYLDDLSPIAACVIGRATN